MGDKTICRQNTNRDRYIDRAIVIVSIINSFLCNYTFELDRCTQTPILYIHSKQAVLDVKYEINVHTTAGYHITIKYLLPGRLQITYNIIEPVTCQNCSNHNIFISARYKHIICQCMRIFTHKT